MSSQNILIPLQDKVIEQWRAIRNICLDELHRHDGLISERSHCSRIGCENLMSPTSSFRCVDCLPDSHKCVSCMVDVHSLEPFHRIEVRIISYVVHTYSNSYSPVLDRKVLGEDDSLSHGTRGSPGTWYRVLPIPPEQCP